MPFNIFKRLTRLAGNWQYENYRETTEETEHAYEFIEKLGQSMEKEYGYKSKVIRFDRGQFAQLRAKNNKEDCEFILQYMVSQSSIWTQNNHPQSGQKNDAPQALPL